MGKLVISQELSDKISNSLRIKQSDIDGGANKPIIRKVEHPKKDSPPRQPSPKYSPIKKKDSSRQPSPKYSPITHLKKSNKYKKMDKVNYIKITKIVFLSSIVGGIGITLGIKLGTILFL